MIYIIEGVDASGKTTLIKKMSNYYGMDVLKGSSFEQSKTSQCGLFYIFLRFTHYENIILDRYIYSNIVYASLYSGYTKISDKQFDFIENEIKNKAIIIYLYAEPNVIIDRLN